MLLIKGTFKSFTFTDGPENWHGFTIGVAAIVPDDTGGPNVVPLPAAGLLLLGGLAGLAPLRRRRL